MEAGTLDLIAYRGRDFRTAMTSYGADKRPHDFTGYGALFRVYDKSHNVILEVTTESGQVTLGALGEIAIHLLPVEVTGLPPRPRYTFDLIDPDGEKVLYLHGDIFVSTV